MSKFKPSKIVILREAITKITQILVGKNIKVIQRGLEAKVDYDPKTHLPRAVYLPMIPDDASEDLCDAVEGFLDHEVAHILFTDPSVPQKAKRSGLGKLYEVLEDIHAEGKMTETLRGTKSNLECVSMFYLEKFVEPKLKEAIDSGNTQAEMSLVAPSVLRALSGQWVYKDFLKSSGSKVAEELLTKLAPMAKQLEKIKSSDDAFALTEEVMRLLEIPPQPPEPEDGDGDEDGPSGKSKSPSGKGKRNKDDKPKKGDKGEGDGEGDDDKSEGGDSEGDGSSGQGGGEGDDEGEGDDQEGGGGSGDPDDGDADGQSCSGGDNEGDPADGEGKERNEKNSTKPGGHEMSNGAPKERGVGNLSWDELTAALEDIEGFDEAASDAVADAVGEASKDADYVIYSNAEDKIEPLKFSESSREHLIDSCNRNIEAPVLEMINPIAKSLERAIAARSASVYVGGKTSGRLHGPGLVQLKFGQTKVFKKKEENTTKDVAVELVVDASGSMSGNKILTATRSAFALCSVLEKLGIKNEVIAFTTGPENVPHSERMKARSMGIRYARCSTIDMPVLKEFHEPLNATVRARFGALPVEVSLESNVDGESVEYAARRLSKQTASRHVMIVLSDGHPACYGDAGGDVLKRDLKARVKRIEDSGIDVVGIGIESDAVKHFYKRNVVIRSANDLPTMVIHQLRDLLLPGK